MRREGLVLNHKRTYRLYREETLQVRTKKRKKLPRRDRVVIALSDGPMQRWSLDFMSDQLTSHRRFRLPNIVDDFPKWCLRQIVDFSIGGERLARFLDAPRPGEIYIIRRNNMDRSEFENQIIRLLTAWTHLGDMTNKMGTRLIGHVPHVAPKAYLHVIFAPLSEEDNNALSEALGRPLPEQLHRFLSFANGMMIYSGSIRVMGYEKNYKFHSLAVYDFPPSILSRNVHARMKGLSDAAVIVGFYKEDGSYVSIEEDERVVRFDAQGDGGSIQEWRDFDTWLFSEIDYLSGFFDREGKMTADPSRIFAPH